MPIMEGVPWRLWPACQGNEDSYCSAGEIHLLNSSEQLSTNLCTLIGNIACLSFGKRGQSEWKTVIFHALLTVFKV